MKRIKKTDNNERFGDGSFVYTEDIDDWVKDKLLHKQDKWSHERDGIEERIERITQYLGFLTEKLVESGQLDLSQVIRYFTISDTYEIVEEE